jgi:hypothetical protein
MASNTELRGTRRFPFLRNYPVSLQRAEGTERLVGQVVGTVNSERVIVCGLEADALTPGDEVIVQMAVGAEVLGFRTNVLEASGVGMTLYMLAVPERVEAINLRKGDRMSLFIPAEVQFSYATVESSAAADLALLQGMMVNLSKGGCCLSTKRPLSMNQPIRLSFSLPGGRHNYRLGGKVLRHLNTPRPGVFAQAVAFDKQTEHLPALADLNQWMTQNLPFALAN